MPDDITPLILDIPVGGYGWVPRPTTIKYRIAMEKRGELYHPLWVQRSDYDRWGPRAPISDFNQGPLMPTVSNGQDVFSWRWYFQEAINHYVKGMDHG